MHIVNITRCLSFSILFLFLSFILALAHPADGFSPKSMEGKYGGLPANLTHNDLLFLDMADREPKNTLTDQEKYMLAGATGSTIGKGTLQAWYMEVFFAARLYYQAKGEIPDVLDEAALRQVYPFLSVGRLQVFRNPLTGAWPHLRSTSFAQGDLYIRPITTDEMDWFAQRNERLRDMWFHTTVADASQVKAGTPLGEARRLPGQLDGAVYYLRLYGRTGVLKTDLLTMAKDS